jgi:hypothetical protein
MLPGSAVTDGYLAIIYLERRLPHLYGERTIFHPANDCNNFKLRMFAIRTP